jgi:hypothetical protein
MFEVRLDRFTVHTYFVLKKGKAVALQGIKEYGGGGVAPFIFNLGSG